MTDAPTSAPAAPEATPAAAPAAPEAAASPAVSLPAAPQPVLPPTPGVAFRAWKASVRAAASTWTFAKFLNDLVKGFRSLIVFAVMLGMGLCDTLGSVDLTGVLTDYFPNLKVGHIMSILSALGIGLRLISNTPVFQSWKTGRATGSVDEPI